MRQFCNWNCRETSRYKGNPLQTNKDKHHNPETVPGLQQDEKHLLMLGRWTVPWGMCLFSVFGIKRLILYLFCDFMLCVMEDCRKNWIRNALTFNSPLHQTLSYMMKMNQNLTVFSVDCILKLWHMPCFRITQIFFSFHRRIFHIDIDISCHIYLSLFNKGWQEIIVSWVIQSPCCAERWNDIFSCGKLSEYQATAFL